MTYDVYAHFPEGAYKVCEGNNADHAADMAEKVLKAIGQWPYAISTLTRGEHSLRCQVFSFDELKKRG